MTSTSLLATCPLLTVVLHGAAIGGLIAAGVLTRARVRGWTVTEPWAITAAWSLAGAGLALAVAVVAAAA